MPWRCKRKRQFMSKLLGWFQGICVYLSAVRQHICELICMSNHQCQCLLCMLWNRKQESDHPNSSKPSRGLSSVIHSDTNRFWAYEKSSLRLQTHLYKHPADAELQRTGLKLKRCIISKGVVIHLLLAVHRGDGGSSGGFHLVGWWQLLRSPGSLTAH